MEKNNCIICGSPYVGKGHNPDPVKTEGRCCNTCNIIHVIPLRISIFSLEGGDAPKP